jgi:hypothetical protein
MSKEAFGRRHGLGQAVVMAHRPEATHPSNGKWQPTPAPAMHRALAVPADNPADERWVTLRSVRVCNSDAYVVAVVDGRNVVTDWRAVTLTPDPDRARRAANRLYDRLAIPTEED